jgi:hypothetical protein
MKSVAKWNPFRTRNVLAVALGLGIVAGIWLGDLFKGFGWGPGQGPGLGSGESAGNSAGSSSSDGTTDLVGLSRMKSDPDEKTGAGKQGPLIKVLIDDRSYYLQDVDGPEPIELHELVELIRKARPDQDGLRAIIDRTSTSRVTAEVKLFDALKEAGIPANSVYIAPTAVE